MTDQGKLDSFFNIMKFSPANIQAGFTALMEQDDALLHFERTVNEGLYARETFSPPIRTNPDEESYHIPPHHGLSYLHKVANQAVTRKKSSAIERVIAIMKDVTGIVPDGLTQLDNFHVWRHFLEITTDIPVSYYDADLITCVDTWLSSRFDKSFASSQLPKLLTNLLNSDNQNGAKWACQILDYATDFSPHMQTIGEHEYKRLNGRIDAYWLREVLKKTAIPFGEKAGAIASEVMFARLVKAQENGKLQPSSWYRPAIENHEQNMHRNDHEDILVEGARDILLAWFKSPQKDDKYFTLLIDSENGLFRRFALFLATELSPEFDTEVISRIGHWISDAEYHHETYRYLSECFSNLNKKDKSSVVSAIRRLKSGKSDKSARTLVSDRLTWLHAIYQKGSEVADKLKEELEQKHPDIKLTSHPDFLSYITSHWGPGPSPITAAKIMALAKEHRLVQYLNDFKPKPAAFFETPTLGGLSMLLQEAVKQSPDTFIELMDDFREAKPAFQYDLISAYVDLRRKAEFPKDDAAWHSYWPKLIDLATYVLSNDSLWNEKVDDDATHDDDILGARLSWIPSRIADLVELGLNNDEHPIPNRLLPKVEKIVLSILKNATADDRDSSNDQLTHAINSTKGKAFEATISYVLNRARNTRNGDKEKVWKKHRRVFNKELSLCTNANFDVSALFGQYLAHFLYLSEKWTAENVNRIFPHRDYRRSFLAAISGLTYCNGAHRKIYSLLEPEGVFRAALSDIEVRSSVREKLLQRIALALMWGDEPLDAGILQELMDREQLDDIACMVSFIGRVHDNTVPDDVKGRARSLWAKLDAWAIDGNGRKSVLGALTAFFPYVDTLDEQLFPLAQRAVDHLHSPYEIVSLARHLIRLFDTSPTESVALLVQAVDTQQIVYDHEDQLKEFIRKIAERYPREAVAALRQLRSIRGFDDLALELERK